MLPNPANEELEAKFESGVNKYFRDFGHRLAREAPHQSWLLMSLAQFIPAKFIVGELQVPNQDLRPFGRLKDTRGAVNFDFAITRSEIDLRAWKTLTVGWKAGAPTHPQTLKTLSDVAILAEFKLARSTATTHRALVYDLKKLSCAVRFLEHHGCQQIPKCFLIVLDPERILNVDRAVDSARTFWPDFASFPTILVGPDI